VAAIAASRCTNWCLGCSCVSARGALDEAPIVWLDSDWITLVRGICGATTCYCGKGEEDNNEKWKVLRNIYQATGHKGINDCQLARTTQDTTCCVPLEVGSDSKGSAICSMLVWWCLFFCLQGYIKVTDSWYLVFDRYKNEILRWKGHLVMFFSTHSRDHTWNIH
jgi:hypothetical protein